MTPAPRDVLSRIWVAYLLIALVFLTFTDYKKAIRAAQLQTLSRLIPAFDYYKEFEKSKESINPAMIDECINYHRHVIGIIPSEAGQAWGMMAYCYDRKGDTRRAFDALTHSLDANPVFFWPRYNQGIYYLRKGDYNNAAQALSEAVSVNPRFSLLVLLNSKVYLDVFKNSESQKDTDLTRRLTDGYREAQKLMELSMACAIDPQEAFCHQTARLQMRYF